MLVKLVYTIIFRVQYYSNTPISLLETFYFAFLQKFQVLITVVMKCAMLSM